MLNDCVEKMIKINVAASRPYDIHIGKGLLASIGERCAPLIKGRHAVIVSDSNVYPLYGERVKKSLERAGFEVEHYIFAAGEASKNTATLIDLLNFLAKREVTRSDVLIALGGGVTGDLTGLAAALYLRGIQCVQVPTTLLAAVDSSVGGKTAVNLEAGKNLMGAFFQPSLVVCDVDTLQTLSPDVYAQGWAEIIKYAYIKSPLLAQLLLSDNAQNDIEQIIAQCVTIKRDIVAQDEFDTGIRQILNFGHTIGHAIEKCSQYRYSHGMAVAIGMAIIVRGSVALGTCDKACEETLNTLLRKYRLPLRCELDKQELLRAAKADKKRTGNSITLVLPKAIGECILKKTDYDELELLIEKGM